MFTVIMYKHRKNNKKYEIPRGLIFKLRLLLKTKLFLAYFVFLRNFFILTT